jgi:hypothetical protein
MFLFTDRAQKATQPTVNEALPHAEPLRKASRATGISFDYLAKTAERESGFNPQAKAPTSSATGMFQFLEQTWLGMVKQEGSKLGLAQEAAAISSDNGRLTVTDPALRQKILNLREDPAVSAMMAGALAASNGQKLQDVIGRKPTEGEVYLAHFLGPNGARDLISLAEKTPDVKAISSFREAGAANRNVFFDRSGRAKTAGEVYATVTSVFSQNAAAPQSAETSAAKANDLYRVKAEGKPMHGLFRSNGEPVADSVKQTWGNIGQRHKIVGEQRVPFHPTDAAASGKISGIAAGTTPALASQTITPIRADAARGVAFASPLQTRTEAKQTGMEVLAAVQNVRPQRLRQPTSLEGGPSSMPAARDRPETLSRQSLGTKPGQPLDLRQFVKSGRIP